MDSFDVRQNSLRVLNEVAGYMKTINDKEMHEALCIIGISFKDGDGLELMVCLRKFFDSAQSIKKTRLT